MRVDEPKRPSLLLVWLRDELSYQGTKLFLLESTYNKLDGRKTNHIRAHNVMINARKKFIKALRKSEDDEIKLLNAKSKKI